jgi:hypothetical protein
VDLIDEPYSGCWVQVRGRQAPLMIKGVLDQSMICI